MPNLLLDQRPAPLPRRVAPIHHETVANYIRRLARANHLDHHRLLSYLCSRPRGGAETLVIPERLAAAAGLDLDLLIQRLHGLHPKQHGHTARAFVRPACRHCMARHGILEPVPCRLPPQLRVCPRHQLWIGPQVHHHADQLDVAPLPEILRTQRRHHRLRRRDPLLVDTAYQHA
ncbi:MAG: hypothetical protein AB7J32_01825, partial [Pseudonocardia sp.]